MASRLDKIPIQGPPTYRPTGWQALSAALPPVRCFLAASGSPSAPLLTAPEEGQVCADVQDSFLEAQRFYIYLILCMKSVSLKQGEGCLLSVSEL